MANIKYVKVEPVTEIDKLFLDKFTYPVKEWVEVDEDKTILSKRYIEFRDEIEDFDVRDDDIFVASFPRSGTTWTQEMVWLIANDCDFEEARKLLNGRFVFLDGSVNLETDLLQEVLKYDDHINLDKIKNLKEQRFIKTHLPYNLLPKKIKNNLVKPKIIYVSRNPKDVCVSYYHLTKSLIDVSATLDEFCKVFLAGRCICGPYWKHFFSYWNRRNDPNILTIKYEDIKTNMQLTLNQVATFLGNPIPEHHMSKLKEHLSFNSMKYNLFVNADISMDMFRYMIKKCHFEKDGKEYSEEYTPFLRKGNIGSHKEEMSPDMIQKFDEWIAENTKGTGLQFQ